MQHNAKLVADGVVGACTYAQALLDGFVPPADTIGISGLDASTNCSVLAAAIAASGRKFAARYYSKFSGKVLSSNLRRRLASVFATSPVQ